MAKYKCGDKVRIKNDPSIDIWPDDMMDWAGKVMTIREVHGVGSFGTTIYRMEEDRGKFFPGRYWYENMISGLAEPEQAPYTVELRFDGAITTATLKRGGRNVKTAEARCNPKDTYSRAEGARVAVERLFEKKRKEDKPKESKPKIGDKFVVTVKGGKFDHGFGIGDIVVLINIQQDGCFRLVDKSGFIQILHPSEVRPYKEKSK